MNLFYLTFLLFITCLNLKSKQNNDTLDYDKLNITISSEYIKNLLQEEYYSYFDRGFGFGVEVEYYISRSSSLSLLFHDQNWNEKQELNYLITDEFLNIELQKYGISYSYIYQNSENYKYIFSVASYLYNCTGIENNYVKGEFSRSSNINISGINFDITVALRNRINDNLYYNVGTRLTIFNYNANLMNYNLFISLTHKIL